MKIYNKNEIDKISNCILNGGIVALPTDTIYGFSCLATDNNSINKLCKMKQRDEGKQFIVLVSDKLNLGELIDINEEIQDFIDKHTPNNLTMIVNKAKGLKLADVFCLSTLAIRIPKNRFLQSILDKVGYMVTTSCNLQGEDYLNDYKSIMSKFPDIDLVVADKCVYNSKPSTIVDLTQCNPVIVRQGDYLIN